MYSTACELSSSGALSEFIRLRTEFMKTVTYEDSPFDFRHLEEKLFRDVMGCRSGVGPHYIEQLKLDTLRHGIRDWRWSQYFHRMDDDNGAKLLDHYTGFSKDRRPFAILTRPYWHPKTEDVWLPKVEGCHVLHLEGCTHADHSNIATFLIFPNRVWESLQ